MKITAGVFSLLLLISLTQASKPVVPPFGQDVSAKQIRRAHGLTQSTDEFVTTSEQFTLEAQEVAKRFANRLQETRDFNSIVAELSVKKFMDCHLRTMREGKENGIFSQEGLSVPLNVATQARSDELQRYLLARLNVFHLKTLHRISTRDLEGRFDDSFYPADQEYPPGTYNLLMNSPAIATAASGQVNGRVDISIRSVTDLRSVIPVLEQAASMMRKQFMLQPPEDTDLYQKNMNRIGNKTFDSKFWKVSLIEVSEKDAEAARRCLGVPVRRIVAVKAPPFYQLIMIPTGNRLKIASLLCTEPPCVD